MVAPVSNLTVEDQMHAFIEAAHEKRRAIDNFLSRQSS
jgi:hypothetical protein